MKIKQPQPGTDILQSETPLFYPGSPMNINETGNAMANGHIVPTKQGYSFEMFANKKTLRKIIPTLESSVAYPAIDAYSGVTVDWTIDTIIAPGGDEHVQLCSFGVQCPANGGADIVPLWHLMYTFNYKHFRSLGTPIFTNMNEFDKIIAHPSYSDFEYYFTPNADRTLVFMYGKWKDPDDAFDDTIEVRLDMYERVYNVTIPEAHVPVDFGRYANEFATRGQFLEFVANNYMPEFEVPPGTTKLDVYLGKYGFTPDNHFVDGNLIPAGVAVVKLGNGLVVIY